MNTVKARQKVVGKEKDLALLMYFRDMWQNQEAFRTQRARAVRFGYDDQWGDLIEVNGEVMTQRRYLQKTGNTVLQTNQVQNKVETMAGVLVKESLEPICHAVDKDEQQYGEVVTNGVQSNCYRNRIDELYIDWAREACLGGLLVGYESWDNTSGPDGTYDSWTQYVNPNMFIFDTQMDDSRFWDGNAFGRMCKFDFGKVAAKFARNATDYAILCDIYSQQSELFKAKAIINPTDRFKESVLTFMEDPDPTVCMVLEAWTKETKARIKLHDWNDATEEIIDADDFQYREYIRQENVRRREKGLAQGWTEDEIPYIEGDGTEFGDDGFFIDEFWYCRFLAPDGTILWEGESPLPDRSHPFTVRAVPMMDGKIQGYLYPEIDHNIIMNRAIILNDWLIRTNAKGVVVVPKQILGGMDPHEFANAWTSIDDMVFIDMKPGMENMMPKVFYGNAQTFDVAKYLDTFSRMGDKSTAITDALQGKTPFAGASGALYQQMANNSTTSIAAFLKKLHNFIEEIHIKKMKNLVTFYDEERWQQICGEIDGVFDNQNLKLNEIRNITYDLRVKESTETPVYREIAEADAKEFLINGLIGMDDYTEISKRPWIEKLKQRREARQAEMKSAGATPEQQQAVVPQGIRPQPGQQPIV